MNSKEKMLKLGKFMEDENIMIVPTEDAVVFCIQESKDAPTVYYVVESNELQEKFACLDLYEDDRDQIELEGQDVIDMAEGRKGKKI